VLSWLKIFFKNMLGFANGVNRRLSSAHAWNSTTRASPPAITGLPVKTSGEALGSLAAGLGRFVLIRTSIFSNYDTNLEFGWFWGRSISSAPAFNRASPERPRISTLGPFLLPLAESGRAAQLNWRTSFQAKAHEARRSPPN
jgi:hypothetical protein